MSLPAVIPGFLTMSEPMIHRQPRGSAVFWRLYMLSWAVLSCAALGYLVAFALHPQQQDRFLAKPAQSNPESNRAEFDRSQLTEQVRSLNATVEVLKSDLAKYQNQKIGTPIDNNETALAPQKSLASKPVPSPTFPTFSGSNPITTSSIGTDPNSDATSSNEDTADDATIETRPEMAAAPVTPVSPTPTADTENVAPANTEQAIAPRISAPPQPPKVKGPIRNLATSPLRAGRVPPLPALSGTQIASVAPTVPKTSSATQPRVLNKTTNTSQPATPATVNVPQTTARTSTSGSATIVKPAPVAPIFGEPKVRPNTVATAAAVSLSTASSITGLRASWLMLTTNQPGTFASYTPRYVTDPASGTYRLLAGPIINHAEADRVCNRLRAQNINCGVSDYTGAPL